MSHRALHADLLGPADLGMWCPGSGWAAFLSRMADSWVPSCSRLHFTSRRIWVRVAEFSPGEKKNHETHLEWVGRLGGFLFPSELAPVLFVDSIHLFTGEGGSYLCELGICWKKPNRLAANSRNKRWSHLKFSLFPLASYPGSETECWTRPE